MANDNDKDGAGSASGANGAASEPGKEAPAVETIEDRLARLEKEKAESHDRLLRLAAEFENYKKRARRDVDDAVYRARESLLREILPVLDNLERANTAVQRGGSLDSLSQGVKLVEKQLHGALEKFQIKGFESLGEPFDPNRHEAIQHIETTAQPPGAVAEVFARGYMIGDRLLRPAMVAVAKAPAAPSGSGDEPNKA